MGKKWYESIICISDLQEPFSHPDSHRFLEAIKKKYFIKNKTKVINQGDEADFPHYGKWDINPNTPGQIETHEKLISRIQTLWEIFPEQDICISNHTSRPFKLAFKSGLPKIFLKEYSDFLLAPKTVKWADRWEYNEIVFEHGEGVSGQTAAIRKAIQNRKHTSIGHQHSWGGVTYSASFHDIIWGLNTGCLIDPDSYAFEYSKTMSNKPTLGCGVILDCVPHFIPMRLKNKRWIGRI